MQASESPVSYMHHSIIPIKADQTSDSHCISRQHWKHFAFASIFFDRAPTPNLCSKPKFIDLRNASSFGPTLQVVSHLLESQIVGSDKTELVYCLNTKAPNKLYQILLLPNFLLVITQPLQIDTRPLLKLMQKRHQHIGVRRLHCHGKRMTLQYAREESRSWTEKEVIFVEVENYLRCSSFFCLKK